MAKRNEPARRQKTPKKPANLASKPTKRASNPARRASKGGNPGTELREALLAKVAGGAGGKWNPFKGALNLVGARTDSRNGNGRIRGAVGRLFGGSQGPRLGGGTPHSSVASLHGSATAINPFQLSPASSHASLPHRVPRLSFQSPSTSSVGHPSSAAPRLPNFAPGVITNGRFMPSTPGTHQGSSHSSDQLPAYHQLPAYQVVNPGSTPTLAPSYSTQPSNGGSSRPAPRPKGGA
jgi:hypothetical protein